MTCQICRDYASALGKEFGIQYGIPEGNGLQYQGRLRISTANESELVCVGCISRLTSVIQETIYDIQDDAGLHETGSVPPVVDD